MNEALVSVIIPVFDGSAFLRDALASVAAQTDALLEVIIVDNGSTDDSPHIARTWAAQTPVNVARVVCADEPRRGVASARGAGMRLSSGAMLAFLDQDDAWTPDKTRLQMAYLGSHPEAAAVLSRSDNVQQGDVERTGPVTHDLRPGVALRLALGAMLIRRSAFERVGGLSLDVGTADDVDWLMRASAKGLGLGTTDDVVLIRRLHAGNTSNDAEAKRHDFLSAVKHQLDRRRAAARDDSTSHA